MRKQISRTEFDSMTERERNEFITAGGTIYDGKHAPEPARREKKEYLISRGLFSSLSDSTQESLGEQYKILLID